MASPRSTVLITGATGGLGQSAARATAALGARVVVAGRDRTACSRLAASVGGSAIALDLADLHAVDRVIDELEQVDVLVCAAGTQTTRSPAATKDGYETTFQVNYLAHLLLIDRLLARTEPPGQVVLVGSSTHDPARHTGMPAPMTSDVRAMARAEQPVGEGISPRRAGLQRYTTSKLLVTAAALGIAREHPEAHISVFDPGLMAGTGLARDFPLPFRILWASALRATSVLPFASTPSRSGRALARLVTSGSTSIPSGSYLDYRLRQQQPSTRAADPGFQHRLLGESRSMIGTAA